MLDDLITDATENRKIRNEIICNLPVFLDVFHMLQAKSARSYPLIEHAVMKEDFIKEIDVLSGSHHVEHLIDNLCTETVVQSS